nr:hypothetical protein [Vaginisenegalia massiliensis]
MTIPTAAWIASGDYHHHLAVNQWQPGLKTREINDGLGLLRYQMVTNDSTYFKETLAKVSGQSYLLTATDRIITICDPNGIVFDLILNEAD